MKEIKPHYKKFASKLVKPATGLPYRWVVMFYDDLNMVIMQNDNYINQRWFFKYKTRNQMQEDIKYIKDHTFLEFYEYTKGTLNRINKGYF